MIKNRWNKWSENEIKILKENYGKMRNEELEKLLPQRNKKEIQRKASRLLLKFKIGRYSKIPHLHLSSEEGNYLSSAIDGEGMLTLNFKKGKWLQPLLEISNTEESFIDYLTNSSFGLRKGKQSLENYKPCFYARKYGFGILPYLKEFLKYSHHERKKEIAKLMIEFIESRLRTNYREGYSEREMEIYYRIKELNKRTKIK